jgi:HEAT repeat protein
VPVKWLLIAWGCILAGGCGKIQPPLAGGKPVGHWVQALSDPDAKMRKEAVFKLGNVGSSDASVIPALIGALKDSDSRVRCEAILALLKSGRDAQQAIDPLGEMQLHDRDAKVREFAAKGLRRLQQDPNANDPGRSP